MYRLYITHYAVSTISRVNRIRWEIFHKIVSRPISSAMIHGPPIHRTPNVIQYFFYTKKCCFLNEKFYTKLCYEKLASPRSSDNRKRHKFIYIFFVISGLGFIMFVQMMAADFLNILDQCRSRAQSVRLHRLSGCFEKLIFL